MPLITRTRQTRWQTSDQRFHDSASEAREHEKRIQLALCCKEAGVPLSQIASLMNALLSNPHLMLTLVTRLPGDPQP